MGEQIRRFKQIRLSYGIWTDDQSDPWVKLTAKCVITPEISDLNVLKYQGHTQPSLTGMSR